MLTITEEFKEYYQKQNYGLNNQVQRSKINKNKIKITSHAIDRFMQRVENRNITEKQLKEIAFKARYYGISTYNLKPKHIGNNEKLYKYLTNRFRYRTKAEEIRYYGGYVFIFCGHKGRVLKTIINIPQDILSA